MISFYIGNIFTDIKGDFPEDLYKNLERSMSFRPDGYLFSPSYNKFIFNSEGKRVRRFWDGWKKQIWRNKKRTYFPTGLFSIAKDFCNKNGIKYSCFDCRKKPDQNFNLSFSTKIVPREYQDHVSDLSCKTQRGIFSVATGGGKTIISGLIISKLKVKPFIFFVTSIDLLTQAKEEFESFFFENGNSVKIGQIGGGSIDIADINVMTVQTAVRALGKKWDSKLKFDDEDSDDVTPIESKKDEIFKLLRECRGAICDECLVGDTLVVTRDGPVRIDQLHEHIGKEILSFYKYSVIWKKITNFYRKEIKKTIKITLSNGMSVQCTLDHLIMTRNGWSTAEEIRQGDLVLSCAHDGIGNGHYETVESIVCCNEELVFDITVEDSHCFFANGILVHNCQHWRAETCQIVCRSLENSYYIFGCSATPYRDTGDDLLIQSCFGKNIVNISASHLIKDGWLIKPRIKMVHVRNEPSIYKTWQEIYKDQITNNTYYNELVCDIANNYIQRGKLVLVLAKQIDHCKKLTAKIPGALFLSGDATKKVRKEGIDKLRNREISCIVATSIWDEGVDVKCLDTVILAGQGKSKTRALQRIGRIMRKNEGKNEAIAIDFYVHQKYLKDHAKDRQKIYESEPQFEIEHIDIKKQEIVS